MDIIDKAIEDGKHISENDEWNRQTWDDFEKAQAGLQVVLFGAGVAADIFFKRLNEKINLWAVIDNDVKKQGLIVGEILPEAFESKFEKVRISGISVLDSIDKGRIIAVIAGINAYDEMAEQLKSKGIDNIYILLAMEANKRACSGQIPDNERIKHLYAEECCSKYDVDSRKIFFRAYGDYADHGKYITQALLCLRNDLDIVWEVNSLHAEIPSGIRKIYSGNWKSVTYEMETARIWVLDLVTPSNIIKRNGQIYIQTKHWASITLKKFYLDAATFKTVPERIKDWKRDFAMIDYIITGSDFDTESCRRGFGFRGEVIQIGSPRSDGLFNAENKKRVYGKYHIPENARTLLYAPTYRFDMAKGKNFHKAKPVDLEFVKVKKALEKKFGGEWHILLRLHPSVANGFNGMERPDFVSDASRYADSEELVSAADITISDFSSIMFEPAFVKKPVFLFVTDKQDYIKNEYELLIDYNTLPFPVAESNDELVQNIEDFDKKEYDSRVESFLQEYGVNEDGHASERAASFISDLIG